MQRRLTICQNGSVALDDVIAYSEKAVVQGCTCIGNYAINPPPPIDPDYDYRDYADVGEQSSLEDALYGVAMSAAQPTVAVAEHVAWAYLQCSKAPAQSSEESLTREILFVKKLAHVVASASDSMQTRLNIFLVRPGCKQFHADRNEVRILSKAPDLSPGTPT